MYVISRCAGAGGWRGLSAGRHYPAARPKNHSLEGGNSRGAATTSVSYGFLTQSTASL